MNDQLVRSDHDHDRDAALVSSPWWIGPVAGLLAAFVALAVAELFTGFIDGARSPVISVGERFIDATPSWLKTFAVERFGTNDKAVLQGGIYVVLALFAVVVGIVAVRKLWIGLVGIALFAAVGVVASQGAAGSEPLYALPSVVGGIAAVAVLYGLLSERSPLHREGGTAAPRGFDRRKFLVSAGVVGVGSVAVGGLGRMLQRRFEVGEARSAIQLPPPASPVGPVPADAELGAPGVASFTTPNDAFYRIDTALVVPQVNPNDWSLTIKGMVDNELTLTYEDLLDRDLIERDITLVCVSNEVGGPYIGNARWLGVPLRDLLEEAGVQAGSDQLVGRSVDGFTAGTPVEVVMDGRDAMIAIGMNGEPLPVAHGFPARMVVPGLYGYVSATKWIQSLELTTFAAYDAYWLQRGWAQKAPIKTESRIDTPRGLSKFPAGKVPVAGVAWAVHRGIEGVEVKIDDGEWMPATLGGVPSQDTWVQWFYEWDATPGKHTVTVRATDGTGTVQTDVRANPIPDGASGWHSVLVTVT